MSDDSTPLLIPIVTFAMGSLVLYVGLREWRKGLRSVSWPTVEGRVISSTVERDSRTRASGGVYYAAIRFEYTIGDRSYVSDQTRAGGELRTSFRGPAEKMVGRYPAGSAVTVHYDPDEPEQAVLETGTGWSIRFFLLCGLLFISVAGIMLARR